MKQVMLTVASLLFAFVVVQAQQAVTPVPAAVNANAPEMIFEKEVHDFGTFKQGGDGTYEFKFKNKHS